MGMPARQNGPSWIDVATQVRNISVRWFFCDLLHCDADPLLMRSPHTRESMLAAGWVASLTGGGLYFSDDLRELPRERKAWPLPAPMLRHAMGAKTATPEPMVPQEVPEKLPDATLAGRITFSNDILPGASWRLADDGLLTINFTEQLITVSGVQLAAHSAYLQPSSGK